MGTGSLERQTLAQLWEGGGVLNEGQGVSWRALGQKVLALRRQIVL